MRDYACTKRAELAGCAETRPRLNASFGGDFETALSAGSSSSGKSLLVHISQTSFAAKKNLSSRSTARLIRPRMNVIAIAHVNSSCTIKGYRVARFGNEKVYPNIDGVIDTILGTLERRRTL
jgi:hypothetical protein